MATLSQDTLKAASLLDIKNLRKEHVQDVEHISRLIDYDEFTLRFLLPNKPCIFGSHVTDEWRSIQEWVQKDGQPNFEILAKKFGSATVPVADCQKVEYSAQPKNDMCVSEYLRYWQEFGKKTASSSRCLYLKDWHFRKNFPNYQAYQTPVFFSSDWLNEYWDSKLSDDYRFVYMGPKGSWTPFHADVFRSYSWSANICGRKKWLLYPPGQEDYLRNSLGNLAYDVTSPELRDDANEYPHYHLACKPFEVIQEPGEVIFVPSGWHHQVFNIEDTISINHNWLNGFNIDLTWKFLQQELCAVKNSISDCIDMDGWDSQCQMIMKASTGMDYAEFLQLLWTIAAPRLQKLEEWKGDSKNNCSSRLHESCKTDQPITTNSCALCDENTTGERQSYRPLAPLDEYSETLSAKYLQEAAENNAKVSHNGSVLKMQDKLSKAVSNCNRDSSVERIESHRTRKKMIEDSGEVHQCILGTQNPLDITQSHNVWHWVFDLRKIGDILKSLLEDEDFCRLDKTEVCKDPQELLNEIICVTKDLV